jgi:hypothetical protein
VGYHFDIIFVELDSVHIAPPFLLDFITKGGVSQELFIL